MMRVIKDKDAERRTKKRGMHLTVEMWFADSSDDKAVFIEWMRGVRACIAQTGASWIHIYGDGIPDDLDGSLDSSPATKANIRVIK